MIFLSVTWITNKNYTIRVFQKLEFFSIVLPEFFQIFLVFSQFFQIFLIWTFAFRVGFKPICSGRETLRFKNFNSKNVIFSTNLSIFWKFEQRKNFTTQSHSAVFWSVGARYSTAFSTKKSNSSNRSQSKAIESCFGKSRLHFDKFYLDKF